VTRDEISFLDEIGRADRLRSETQMRHRDRPRLLGVVHEVALGEQLGALTDDLDRCLVGSDRPIRAEAEEDGLDFAGRARDLETGLDRPGSSDGWLNRLLQVMSGKRSGIAIAAGMPLSMTGSFQVESWSPTQLGAVDDAFLERLAVLYRSDRTLANRFEAALQQKDLVGEEPMARGNARRGGITPLMQAAAKILRPEQGPNIAAMEFSGWDTHANQGLAGGALDRLLGQLAEGLAAFRTDMGPAWQNTTVVVMTEFGRTARPNGSRGTDHGTAGAGFVLSTRVKRSHVVADWPGLANKALFEGRDLRPTLDTRAVLKAALAGTFDLTAAQLERVFPGSAALNAATVMS